MLVYKSKQSLFNDSDREFQTYLLAYLPSKMSGGWVIKPVDEWFCHEEYSIPGLYDGPNWEALRATANKCDTNYVCYVNKFISPHVHEDGSKEDVEICVAVSRGWRYSQNYDSEDKAIGKTWKKYVTFSAMPTRKVFSARLREKDFDHCIEDLTNRLINERHWDQKEAPREMYETLVETDRGFFDATEHEPKYSLELSDDCSEGSENEMQWSKEKADAARDDVDSDLYCSKCGTAWEHHHAQHSQSSFEDLDELKEEWVRYFLFFHPSTILFLLSLECLYEH